MALTITNDTSQPPSDLTSCYVFHENIFLLSLVKYQTLLYSLSEKGITKLVWPLSSFSRLDHPMRQIHGRLLGSYVTLKSRF